MSKVFLKEYVTYNNGEKTFNGYWELRGNKLFNLAGGFHYYNPSPNDEFIEVEDASELDWSYLCDNDSLFGWLSPNGEFYGCNHMQHQFIANYVLHHDEDWLEHNGWIKIFRSWPDWTPEVIGTSRLTKAQKDFLLERGIEY